MEILKKISNAKILIKNSKIEKLGLNKFSNYKYFTPEQVEKLVSDACENQGLLTKFDLKRNEFGVIGMLTIYDINSSEKLDFQMATAIPEIKATNIAQQLGGCVTYTERYLKSTAFGISENHLDFDSKDNTEKPKEVEKPKDKPIFTMLNFEKARQAKATIEQIESKYQIDEITKQNYLKFINI
jgi:hypothetical protein